MIGRAWWIGALVLVVGGCAVRLGGPGPVEYRTVALSAAGGATPAQIAAYLKETGANVVLLAAPADSAWFAEVARRVELKLSGPGSAGQTAFAFLATEPVGDTTVVLGLPDGGELVVHDALYRVDKNRYLDLLATHIGSADSSLESIRALLRYVATDVMTRAAVVLAIEVPDAETGDRVAQLLEPAFLDARECLPESARAAASGPGMRLFYGPEARLRCESARVLEGDAVTMLARLIVGR